VVATPGALEALRNANQSPGEFIKCHLQLDPGDLDKLDQAANRSALANGSRIFSAYHTSKGEKLWVITEADRSSTCILLPEEY
jgi:hypothetical protein